MNAKKFQIVLVLTLVVAFTSAFTTLPAPITDPIRDPAALLCYQMQHTAASIDIPSRWSDYQLLDQVDGCGKAAESKLVPITGSQERNSSRPAFIYDATGAMLDAVVYPPSDQ